MTRQGLAAAVLLLAIPVGCATPTRTSSTAPPTPSPTYTIETPVPPTPTPAPGITRDFAARQFDGGEYKWPYRLHVEFVGPDPNADRHGCWDPVAPGKTSLPFRGSIQNMTADREAPVPTLLFDSNRESPDVFDHTGDVLVTTTRDTVNTYCVLGGMTGQGDETLDPGGSAEITGLIYGIPDPVPVGTKLIIKVGGPDTTTNVSFELVYTPTA